MEVYGYGVFSFRNKVDLSYVCTVNGYLILVYDIRYGSHVYKLYDNENKETLRMTLMYDYELIK